MYILYIVINIYTYITMGSSRVSDLPPNIAPDLLDAGQCLYIKYVYCILHNIVQSSKLVSYMTTCMTYIGAAALGTHLTFRCRWTRCIFSMTAILTVLPLDTPPFNFNPCFVQELVYHVRCVEKSLPECIGCVSMNRIMQRCTFYVSSANMSNVLTKKINPI